MREMVGLVVLIPELLLDESNVVGDKEFGLCCWICLLRSLLKIVFRFMRRLGTKDRFEDFRLLAIGSKSTWTVVDAVSTISLVF